MAQQNRNAYAYNYNYNRNEKVVYYNGSAAPKVRPEPQKKPQLEHVKKTTLTAQQMRQQTAAETRKTIKVMSVAMAILMFMALAIYSRVKLDEINREISSVEKKIELADAEVSEEKTAAAEVDSIAAENDFSEEKTEDTSNE